MKLKKIKTEAEIAAAITVTPAGRSHVELTTSDGNVKGVRIGRAHFSVDSYTFTAQVEVEHDEAKRYRVLAKVAGFPDAVNYFENHADASAKKGSYAATADVTMEQVSVLIDAAGNVVAEIGEGSNPVDHNGDDVPF